MNESNDKAALVDQAGDAAVAVVESDSEGGQVTVVDVGSEASAGGEAGDAANADGGEHDDVSDDATAAADTADADSADPAGTDPADIDNSHNDTEITAADADTPVGDTAGALDVTAAAGRRMIDPRGPRFGAAITVVVLAAALVTIPSITSVVLLGLQAIVFGAAALFGLKAQPYGWIYRSAVAPRLGPPSELEDEAPPRFAQQVGLAFVVIALVGLAIGIPLIAQIATAFALAAAFLNAAFNFCLGCEMYVMFHRIKARKAS